MKRDGQLLSDSSCATSIAVLAGGKSSRMGSDKALLRLTNDGPTLLEIVIQRVRPLTDDLFVVASERPEYAGFGLPVRPDRYSDGAVLGAVGSAISHARHDRCLLVSCDHPFLSVSLLSRMISWPGEWDALVPTTRGESRQGGDTIRQTLHAVYHKRCLDEIERMLLIGQRQIVRFLDQVRVEEIDEVTLRRFDPLLRSFFSVNTPEALMEAKRWARLA